LELRDRATDAKLLLLSRRALQGYRVDPGGFRPGSAPAHEPMLGGRHKEKLALDLTRSSAKTRDAAQSDNKHEIEQLTARRFAGVVVRVEPAAGIPLRLFQRLRGWRH